MSGSVNTAILVGNLGSDPEVSRMQNGKPVVKFSLATTERWKDQSGEQKERTTWHRIVIFSEGLCRVAEQYLRKGSQVFIQGSITNRSYESDGQTKYVSEVVLQGFNSTLTMLGGKQGGDFQSSQNNPQSGGSAGSQGDSQAPDIDDSEVPF